MPLSASKDTVNGFVLLMIFFLIILFYSILLYFTLIYFTLIYTLAPSPSFLWSRSRRHANINSIVKPQLGWCASFSPQVKVPLEIHWSWWSMVLEPLRPFRSIYCEDRAGSSRGRRNGTSFSPWRWFSLFTLQVARHAPVLLRRSGFRLRL